MDAPGGVTQAPDSSCELPRLLYIGDVAVADTLAGEALLFRLLQGYPPDRLAVICSVRPDMPKLPGVAYYHHGAAFRRLLFSRIAPEYCLWRAWQYYLVPRRIADVAAAFRPDALLSISHVSGWLGAWQLGKRLGIPMHLVAHDDLVYANRFPEWAQGWATRRFGEAYRAARSRLCISETMEEIYAERFGAPGLVIYPTTGARDNQGISPRVLQRIPSLTFAYGGSINSASDIEQIVTFARVAGARGHRLLAYTPQHDQLIRQAGDAASFLEVRRPVHSAELRQRLRAEADCLLLPQSLVAADRLNVATAFPTKWADYSTLGLPMLVWAPPGSSSARFVGEHPGCAELVTSSNGDDVDAAIARIECSPDHRYRLAEALLRVSELFAPEAAWQRFRSALTSTMPC